MTDYFVDPNVGNDGNAGTALGAGNAWATLQKGLDTAVAGDVVSMVASATETVSAIINVDTANGTVSGRITIQGVDGSGDRLPAGSYYSIQQTGAVANLLLWSGTNGQYYNWVGIDFDGTDTNTANLLDMTAVDGGKYNAFTNCRIQRSGSNGVRIRGSFVDFVGCEVDNNAGFGLTSASPLSSRWGSADVTNCRIHDNAGGGAYISSGARSFTGNQVFANTGDGLYIGNGSNVAAVVIDGNTFYNNSSDGAALSDATPTTIAITNNTFVDNGAYGLDMLTTNTLYPSIDFNHYSDNTTAAARFNNASVTEANINTNGNLGIENQTGGTASSLFTTITAGSEDLTPKNGTALDGNGLYGADIGALPAADGAGGGGDPFPSQSIQSLSTGLATG